MEDVQLIASVLLIHFFAVISPGPDFFMALKNALTYSRRIGIYTAIGFGLGIGVHILYSAFGLALIISKSIIAFTTIKYLGVIYLIYLGLSTILNKTEPVSNNESNNIPTITPLKAISQGFFTNVLNPKASLFFLSLFTLVVAPNTAKSTITLISLFLIINTILWFSFVAVFMTQKRIRSLYHHYQNRVSKVFGGILIAIGIKIAFSD